MTPNAGEDAEKLDLPCTGVGMPTAKAALENSLAVYSLLVLP